MNGTIAEAHPLWFTPGQVQTAAYLRGTRGHQGRRATVSVAGLLVKVPEWVAHSVYSKESLLAQEAFPVPRFVEVVRDQATPVSLQGVSRFKQTVGACRCVVTPNHLIHTIKAVLEGIFEAECFLEHLTFYYESYLIGSVGMNQFMREMNGALKMCWDFKYLAANEPKTRHYKAALFVYEQLKPTLKFTTWPVDPHFSFVHKAMPAETGTHGWHRQYHTLLKRVRAASVSRWRSRNWWRIQNVVVQPVMTNGALMASLGQISPWRFLSHGTKQCLLGLIGELVGGGPAMCFLKAALSSKHWQFGSSGFWQHFADGKDEAECTSVPWRCWKFCVTGV